ncbi:sulfate transporter family-domain-containing protein [Dactylonectria macrodidyma]|uniref:Sulfate transporter family-domain-containing protein n=1 Tax=Dactylonectria macrodidyma TaxID=307937 RepID=A0A9P9D3I6_9HYPO|nr:sulfate transporter family-domain-containing protein [Dactylonectria macrodidyma]
MSSPPGFTPWRRRAMSSTSQSNPAQLQPSNAVSSSPSQGSQHSMAYARPSSIASAPGHREPIRYFIHGSVRESLLPVDNVQNARSVRVDTAELASYLLSDRENQPSPAFLQRARSSFHEALGSDMGDDASIDDHTRNSETIVEVSEPPSPENRERNSEVPAGPSVLANLLKRSRPQSTGQNPPQGCDHDGDDDGDDHTRAGQSRDSYQDGASEQTSLLTMVASGDWRSYLGDLEGQKSHTKRPRISGFVEAGHKVEERMTRGVAVAVNPSRWDRKALWQDTVVGPVSCMPAVAVGLLLNILDALSYGMILFPLGKPIFAHLGSAGISIFYVSTIVSQITFSARSIFKGSIGSELVSVPLSFIPWPSNMLRIEVVPFFHNMAVTITSAVGEDNSDAVIATTIVSYAISSMVTGLVFYLTGRFKVGYMVGFIPRHILIGCIGGVGWFLLATGFEVSARLDGSLQYNPETLKKLTESSTVPLWVIPLILAIILFYGQSKITSKFFLPLYILAIPLVFYFFVTSLDVLDVDVLRDHGWIFQGPPSGEPWWYFYTLYKFKLVRWEAVLETIPAMFALTFFGILHVPINVPALALNCGEDHADLDKELRLHGYSNFLSGCFGSIQNYLVYANTVLFMRSGGNSRLAGYTLAAATFGVMIVGPSLIGFIPVMMVGTLIFDLGLELLLEALWLPRKKLKLAEYLTVVVIVLVMGIHDFVVGIGVGILLAFVSLILQTSRVSAIRGNYAGDIVTSTVRRNPSQHRYLHEVGRQIYIVKLAGYLFFGTIVSVEEKIRGLLEDSAFAKQPIKFLILDLWHVTGLDYSAGEAFNAISRLLDNKDVVLALSGVDSESQLGRNLRAVGLGSDGIEVMMLPNLNSALESCENELLKTLYTRQEELNGLKRFPAAQNLDVPAAKSSRLSSFDPPFNSPRRNHLVEAARDALSITEAQRPTKWQSFKEPLRLMLQIFSGLSDKHEGFWFPATSYFTRKEYPAGTVIFRRGEQANGFYLVEKGIIRAEYDLPQGWLCESVVTGTTCGELPFFSETERTATAVMERDCVVWLMDREQWANMQAKEPEVGRELLRISLKLTSERMSAITSYILTTAG